MNIDALTTKSTAAMLLADKSRIGTTDARFYLASRMRIRTPGGAAEYLKVLSTHEREAWDGRVKLALDLMSLYRELFPGNYAASRSPHFSTQREHEFYRLVNLRLFPLCLSSDRQHVDLELNIERDPDFFLPYIPVEGTQQHDWVEGCCGFDGLQKVFQLVLALSGHHLGRKHRESFLRAHGLDAVEVAPPLGAYGWSHFKYWLSVHDTWLRYLPLAFHMVAYKTGSPWLDVPRAVGHVGFEWSPQNVGKLFAARRIAEEINTHVLELDRWFRETRVGVVLAIQLWNNAAIMEAEAGMEGLMVEDFPEALGRRVRLH